MACGPKDRLPGSCLYGTPCFACCAPNENPEQTCFRNFSNEWTAPGSSGGKGPMTKCFPICESSICCRTCGKVGLAAGDANRKGFMLCGAFFNLLFMILSIIGCLGMSEDAGTLKKFAWVHGEADGSETFLGVTSKIDTVDCSKFSMPDVCALQMPARGFERDDDLLTYKRVVNFADSGCAREQLENATAHGLIPKEVKDSLDAALKQCDECKSNLLTSTTLIMGIITSVPSILTDLQRTTRYGDINCQSTAGSVGTFFSVIMNVISLSNFATACKKNMPDTVLGPGNTTVNIKWTLGTGFMCVLIGTILKIVDSLCHFIVPTPEVRWTKADPPPALLDYFMLAAPTQDTMSGPGATKVGASSA